MKPKKPLAYRRRQLTDLDRAIVYALEFINNLRNGTAVMRPDNGKTSTPDR